MTMLYRALRKLRQQFSPEHRIKFIGSSFPSTCLGLQFNLSYCLCEECRLHSRRRDLSKSADFIE